MKNIFFLLFAVFCLGMGRGRAQYTNLLSFNGTNGHSPQGSLTQSGNTLYGMTYLGGLKNYGCVFSIDTNGSGYKDLYDFNDTTGAYPYGSLLLSGNVLYGMTYDGGANNIGCIFSVKTDGSSYKKLLDFNITNGKNPQGSLIYSNGRLFGMARWGGIYDYGIIFSIDTDGSGYKNLNNFNLTNGGYPFASLYLSGNVLYGMTCNGGANSKGCIFSIDSNGSNYKDIFDFNGINGAYPTGSLTNSGSQLYGMANLGGIDDSGCIFSIDTDGSSYKKLLDFNTANGSEPWGSLVLSGNILYGMTGWGGLYTTSGTIFSIDTNGAGFNEVYKFPCGLKGCEPNGDLTISGNMMYGMTQAGGSFADGVIFSFKDSSISTSISRSSVAGILPYVYPNPSKGIFTIQSSMVSGHPDSYRESIEVYNVLGEKVYSSSYQPLANSYQLKTIDLSSNPNGVYFYRILKEDGGLVGEGKLIINK